MIGGIAVMGQCAQTNAAIGQLRNTGEIQAIDVHQTFGLFDTVLHQIDQVRSASKNLCSIRMGQRVDDFFRMCWAVVLEGKHQPVPEAASSSPPDLRYTLRMASTIPG